MYIEVITLETFSALPKADINSTTPSRQRLVVFHSCLSDDSAQDTATTNAQIKCLIPFLKDKKYRQHHWIKYGKTLMVVPNKFICASTMYLM